VQEILQRLEHERTEPSATLVGALEKTTFEHHNEKILGEVLGLRDRVALAANESENRPPINFAKFRKGSARLLLVTSRIRAG
jgi:hypothetical protein